MPKYIHRSHPIWPSISSEQLLECPSGNPSLGCNSNYFQGLHLLVAFPPSTEPLRFNYFVRMGGYLINQWSWLKFTTSTTVLADVVFLILRQTYEAKPRNSEASCSAQACQTRSTRDHDQFGCFLSMIMIMMDNHCMIMRINYD